MGDTSVSFEGAIRDVSPRQLEFIASVLQKHGYDGAKVNIEVLGKAEDNFMAVVKRITAEKDGKSFKMIAKIAPTIEQLRFATNAAMAFANESVMYTEVLPKFTELEIAAGVPESERLRYAVGYGSLLEAPNEVILLEDLNESNHVLLDRYKPLTDGTIRLILKNFARLHSLSYALAHKEPETYNEMKAKLKDFWMEGENIDQVKMFAQGLEMQTLQILDNEKYKKPFRGLLSDSRGLMERYSVDAHLKHAVIIQGDPWTNNILFKLEDDKPVECCMIDYQISRSGNPVIDIHYMVFSCTDYETRKKHYLDWIDYYHHELDNCLANFGLKANLIYPKDKLDADLKRYAKLSLAFAVILASVLIRESGDAAKFKEEMQKNLSDSDGNIEEFMEAGKMTNLDNNTLLMFKKRIEETVDSFLELGYISE